MKLHQIVIDVDRKPVVRKVISALELHFLWPLLVGAKSVDCVCTACHSQPQLFSGTITWWFDSGSGCDSKHPAPLG